MYSAPGSPKMKKIFCARKAPGTAADHADLIENPKFEPPHLGVSAGSAIFFLRKINFAINIRPATNAFTPAGGASETPQGLVDNLHPAPPAFTRPDLCVLPIRSLDTAT